MARTRSKKLLYKVVLLSIVLLIIYYPGYKRIKLLQEERENLERKIEKIKKENEILEKRIYRLKNDASYIEERAREKLGLYQDGEIIYDFGESEK